MNNASTHTVTCSQMSAMSVGTSAVAAPAFAQSATIPLAERLTP
jgi:hypothetical protein